MNRSTIDIKIAQIVKEFSALENNENGTTAWEKKYEKLIELGKALPAMSDADKIEDLKLKGCQSQVWLKASLSPEGNITFQADSDAIIVKGLVALVLAVYNNETPETILETEPVFLKVIGLDKGLSPSRSNGLNSMIKQIKYYATAYRFLKNR